MPKDILESKLMDAARACAHSGEPRFTRFLEPVHVAAARHAAKECGVKCELFGGYEGAERVMAGFTNGAPIEGWQWPMQCLKLSWNQKYASPSHRDLLGATMAQGMERACLGDIVLGDSLAYLLATPEAADYLSANMDSAGQAKLKLEMVSMDEVQPVKPKGRSIRVTVPSLRLDAVLAECGKLSRAQAQNMVARGLVKLNHLEQLRADARLSEGDLISARGVGRIRIERELGETRKGRMAVQLFLYGD